MSFSNAPTEIICLIFSNVDRESVFVLPRVCRRWRSICSTFTVVQEIKWKHPLKSEAFFTMLSRFGRFESFDISNEIESKNAADDFVLKKIVRMHFELKSLCLMNTRMTDSGISKIGEGCPNLQSLDLSSCSQVTDVGILKIGEGCPQLQSLNLKECENVTDIGITKIGEGCPQLQSLNLYNCSKVTDVGISLSLIHI